MNWCSMCCENIACDECDKKCKGFERYSKINICDAHRDCFEKLQFPHAIDWIVKEKITEKTVAIIALIKYIQIQDPYTNLCNVLTKLIPTSSVHLSEPFKEDF